MAVIKCPHCGKYISSTLSHCTECGKELAGTIQHVSTPIDHSLDIIEGYEDEDASELFADPSAQPDPVDPHQEQAAPSPEPLVAASSEEPDRASAAGQDETEQSSEDEMDEEIGSSHAAADTQPAQEEQEPPVASAFQPAPRPRKWYSLSARRIVVLLFLTPFVVLLACVLIGDYYRARDLEQRAYARLESTTDLLVFEDFLLRFPKSQYVEEVRQRYETMKVEHNVFFKEAASGGREALLAFIEAHPSSPYRAVCERRIDTLDWNDALDANTLESFTAYLAKHPEGIFLGEATDARNRQLRLVVTPEETSILRGAIDNFLSAMTARDATRIDELTRGSINFCGMTEATGSNVVEYYQNNIHKDDVLGVHFQLGGTSINKRSVSGSDALSYNLYSNATATINRSSLDSAMVVNYKVSASFSPERRLTSITVTPVVDVPQPAE